MAASRTFWYECDLSCLLSQCFLCPDLLDVNVSLQLRNPVTLSRLVKHILKILRKAVDIFLSNSDAADSVVLICNIMGLEGCHEIHIEPKRA